MVMKADSEIKCSDLFTKARTLRKIVIWADNDEVINDQSSLKNGIMKEIISETLKESHLSTKRRSPRNSRTTLDSI